MKVEFTVTGIPKAKGRPRFARTPKGVRTFTPKETVNYETWVRTCWLEQSGTTIPNDVPIALTVRAFFPIPSSFSKKKKEQLEGQPHCKLPDLDNCVKSVCDGLQGYVFENDSKIYRIIAEKFYSSDPRVEVTMETIDS